MFTISFPNPLSEFPVRPSCKAPRPVPVSQVANLLDATLQASLDGYLRTGAQGAILQVNPACCRISGFSKEQLLAMGMADLEVGASPSAAEERHLRIRQEGATRFQTRHRTWDGRALEVEVQMLPVPGTDQFICLTRDLTEHQRAAEALKEALSFTEQVIASANEGIVVYDAQGRFRLWNPFMAALTGVPAEDVLGKLPEDLFPFLKAVGTGEGIRRALQGEVGRPQVFPWSLPAQGRSGWFLSVVAPVRSIAGGVIGAIEIITDLTQQKEAEALQKRLETKLHHTQKLEGIGSLAAGLAHDMNNVLGAIQAVAEILRMEEPSERDRVQFLETILMATHRGRELLKTLTSFARQDLRGAEPLDLNGLIREEVELLRRTTLQRLDLHEDLEEGLPKVMGTRDALTGALLNILVNAVDAMPAGGSLTLRTRELPGGGVSVEVEDTGRGMPPEVLDRAMEPFFSTKPIGSGTGMGLAMVYSTVKAHGGTVSLKSQVGSGTRVSLRLPALPRPGPPGAVPDGPGQAPRRLLVVDDDELIRASIPLMLQHLGHQVGVAAGGREALELVAAGPPFDLIILDLNMPAMNGAEVLLRLRRMGCAVPVLLATGYLDPATEALLAADGQAWSIAKPFSMQELVEKLQRMATV